MNDVRSGVMCASLAFDGRPGTSANLHVALDFIYTPSGNFTVRGVIVCWTFDIGAADTSND